MSGSTTEHAPSKAVTDRLLRLGTAVMLAGEYPDLPMSDLITTIIDQNISLEAISGSKISDEGRVALVPLQSYLKTVPHDIYTSSGHAREFAIMGLTTILLIARFITRHYFSRKISAADWTMLAAWVVTVFFMVDILLAVKIGHQGHHIYDFSFKHFRLNILLLWAAQIIYTVGITIAKLSWLLFYRDLAPVRWFRAAVAGVAVFTFVTGVATLFLFVFRCKPVNFWDNPMEAKCLKTIPVYMGFTVLTVVGDSLVVLLPTLLIVKALKLPNSDKAILVAMFGSGIVCCLTAVARLLQAMPGADTPDSIYQQDDCSFWTLLELCLAIMVSCIPALRCLLGHCIPGLFGSRGSNEPIPSLVQVDESVGSSPSAKVKANRWSYMSRGKRKSGALSTSPTDLGGDSFEGDISSPTTIGLVDMHIGYNHDQFTDQDSDVERIAGSKELSGG